MIDKPMSPTMENPKLFDPPEDPGVEIEIDTDEEMDPQFALQQAMALVGSLTEDFDTNLAETLDESYLSSLITELKEDYQEDRDSRKDWEKYIEKGLLLLGTQVEERADPWQGACGVFSPLILEAAVRFQSEMISEVFPAMGPVKAKTLGYSSSEQQQAAQRVVEDMNDFLTDKAPEFRSEHERMLFSLSLFGTGFKKTYYDAQLGRPTSIFIPAEDIVVSYGATDLQTAPRITHVMRKSENELRRLQSTGFYRDIENLEEPSASPILDDIKRKIDKVTGASSNDDERYVIYEMMVCLDLEGSVDSEEGLPCPYIVTYLESGDILAIRRNWDPNDKDKKPLQHFTKYDYIPAFGFYSFGLIQLLGNSTEAVTSITRQLVDAGTLSNLPGGLKTNGLRIKGDDAPIMPGEWRDVDIASGTLRDNLVPLPYKEPSATLAQLRETIADEARRLASTADAKLNDMNGEAPVGTMLAIIERTMKVMSAIQARCHVSMSQEFKLIKILLQEYTAPEYSFPVDRSGAGPVAAKKADYAMTDILPVSDPNAATTTQRILQAQAAIQLSQQAPGIYNLPVLHRQMLQAMGVKDAEKIVQTDEDLTPIDPVSENANLLKLSPAKAFIEQNHEAHIAVHNAFVQDPAIQQQMQSNPQAQAILQAIQAHIAEHMGFAYRQQIEQQLGIMLPPPGQPLPPGYESQIAPLLVQAAQQVNQQHAAQAQQQAAQQQMQDPLFQQQEKELQLKAQEINNRFQVDMAKIQSQERIAGLNNTTKLEIQANKDVAAHQSQAADIIHEKMNPPPPPTFNGM